MEIDCSEPLRLPVFILKFVGLWQEETANWAYQIYGVALHFLLIEISTFCHTRHMYNMFREGSLNDISDVLSLLFTWYAVVLKTFWITHNLKKVKKVFETIQLLAESFSSQKSETANLKRNIKSISRICKSFYGFYSMSILSTVLLAFLYYNRVPYETWFFWDYENDKKIFMMLSIYQIISASYGIGINFACDIIQVISISMTSALIEDLSDEISEIGKCFDPDKIGDNAVRSREFERLRMCIQLDVRIRSLVRDISRHLTFPFLMQATMSAVILCTSTFLLCNVSNI